MALIICPECKKEISDQASVCPNCGFPLSKPELTVPIPVDKPSPATSIPKTTNHKKRLPLYAHL